MPYFALKIWRYAESPYLCNVFFIVLDLRLTKVGARRCSFFYACTFRTYKNKRYTPRNEIYLYAYYQ